METTTTNPTLKLIDMLVAKHGLNREKTIQYVKDNSEKSASMMAFLSGFIHNLSINTNGLKANLK